MIDESSKVIFIVENRENWLDLEYDYFRDYNFKVLKATTRQQALEFIKPGTEPDLVLVNLNLRTERDGEGIEILESLQRNWPAIPRVIITARTIDQPRAFTNEYGVDEIKYKLVEDPDEFDLQSLGKLVFSLLKGHKFEVKCNPQHTVIPRALLHSYQTDILKEYPDLQLFELTIDCPLDKKLEAVIIFNQDNRYIQETRFPVTLQRGKDNIFHCSPLFTAKAGEGAPIAISNIQIKIGEKKIWETSQSYIFEVGDTLPILLKNGAMGNRRVHFLAATCITPYSDEVSKLAGQVRKIWGEKHGGGTWRNDQYTERDILEVAEILRDLLRTMFIREDRRPVDRSDNEKLVSHSALLPDQVIKRGGANCFSYSLIYASILENFDVQPLLLFLPGHVMPGWKKSRSRGGSTPYEFRPEYFTFLEQNTVFIESTQTTHNTPFDELVKSGKDRFINARKILAGGGTIDLVDVKYLRSKRFAPYAGR